jgi:hypothetical protein
MRGRGFFIAVAAILCAGLLLAARLIDGESLRGLQDGSAHVLWAQQFLKGLSHGELYPRWLVDTNLGFGSVSFVFYPPLVFYSYALINVFVRDIALVVTVSSVLSLLCSGLSMYPYCRVFLGRGLAVFSSVAYMALPYHMYSIYEKGALGEQWAYCWPPLILYFVHRAGRGHALAYAGLAMTYAGLILTHVPTTILFSPILLAYLEFVETREKRPSIFLFGLLALLAGAALSSFYLLPAVFEQKYIHVEDIVYDSYFYVWNNFIFTGGAGKPGELNLHISWMAVSSLVVLLLMGGTYYALRGGDRAGKADRVIPAVVVLGIVAFIFMTRLSSPVWKAIGLLQNLQFPWRLMVMETMFTALGAGWLIKCASQRKGRLLRVGIALVLAPTLFVSGLLSFKTIKAYEAHGLPGPKYRLSADMDYERLRNVLWVIFPFEMVIDLIDVPEYKPVWATHDMDLHKTAVEKMRKGNGYTLLEGGREAGGIRVIKWHSEDRLMTADIREATAAVLRTYYHPHWRAFAGERPLEVGPDPDTGFMRVLLPEGRYIFTLTFHKGVWFTSGVIISALAALALAAFAVYRLLMGLRGQR